MPSASGRYAICIPMEDAAARLRWARQQAGLESGSDAARALGVPEPTYLAHENGSRGFKSQAEKYSRRYRVSLDWLLTGRGHPKMNGQIPVVGHIGAGEEVYPIDDSALGAGIDYTDAPPGTAPDAVAVRVRGESMFPAYWDGDLLIYRRDYSFVRDVCLYNECIVKIVDGPTLVKRVMPGSAEGLYTLLSYNAPPVIDARLEWAAPVQIHDKRRRRAKSPRVA